MCVTFAHVCVYTIFDIQNSIDFFKKLQQILVYPKPSVWIAGVFPFVAMLECS